MTEAGRIRKEIREILQSLRVLAENSKNLLPFKNELLEAAKKIVEREEKRN